MARDERFWHPNIYEWRAACEFHDDWDPKSTLTKKDGTVFAIWMKDAPSEEFTQEVADRYIKQAKQQLDKVFYCFAVGELEGRVVENLIRKWYPRPRIKHGTACCNELITNLNLDGTIMKCPYGTDVIGTIDNPPTNDVFDSFIPEKCKSCEFWEVCRCECVASVTGLDCYVNRTMIPYVRELIKKYDVEDKVKALFTQRNNKG